MHKLPNLPYDYSALEPYIDARTMEIHHDKHHQGYVNKLNAAIERTEYAERDLEDLLQALNDLPEDLRTAVRNNGGGHYNHSLFWATMSPSSNSSGQADGGGEPGGDLASAIKDTFGSFTDFKEQFSTTAAGQFGSGWGWLTVSNGKLQIESTPNQDSPVSQGRVPILGVDVWEHAYYLKYQNKRGDYLENWWNVVNWEEVARRYGEAV